ncbi:uncharacterized protein H6S33_002279 [Morchella sextelata]|uniref:uncharacterized protein n=1 Tax=Morchella sextelata TaxID=1174677 RepID=UPI001D05B9EB|nr:uncharacterized protein H6S33_002279 [Morchella sextelata]KAH0608227.1 hypothetical protein H6S33_002279 [Morchella sextelata]
MGAWKQRQSAISEPHEKRAERRAERRDFGPGGGEVILKALVGDAKPGCQIIGRKSTVCVFHGPLARQKRHPLLLKRVSLIERLAPSIIPSKEPLYNPLDPRSNPLQNRSF